MLLKKTNYTAFSINCLHGEIPSNSFNVKYSEYNQKTSKNMALKLIHWINNIQK